MSEIYGTLDSSKILKLFSLIFEKIFYSNKKICIQRAHFRHVGYGTKGRIKLKT